MRARTLVLIVVICGAVVCGCTKKGPETNETKQPGASVHGSGGAGDEVGFVPVLKKQKLANYPSDTIGNAFDSYVHLVNKEWKQNQLNTGQTVIDFVGWLEPQTLGTKDMKEGIKARGVDIAFVIEKDGSYYVLMVSKIQTHADGTLQKEPLNNTASILASIYANKKINL